MMQLNNKVIIASAGSGKTTQIVTESINSSKKILIVTYTNDNLEEIRKKFIEMNGIVPSNVKIMSWFSFLLSDGVRPYQCCIYDKKRISNIAFVNGRSTRFAKKTDIERYYLSNGENIYTDKISEFVTLCNEKTNGAVVTRLEEIYDCIYIDEVQDLAGYDLDLIGTLLKSKIEITMVGDIRQATYATNSAAKNKKYAGAKIYDFFKECEKRKLCSLIFKTESYRCNEDICKLSDSIYPDLPKTESKNNKVTGHDGIFVIKSKDVDSYREKYNPKVLRYDRKTKFDCEDILNFGQAKGLTFDRVLIVPNGKLKKYLETGDVNNIEASKAKVYVALTRAKHSVAFLYDKEVNSSIIKLWG